MRILLRQVRTRCYSAAPDQWTEDRNLALSFQTSVQAMNFVHQHRLEGLELVLTFGRPELDLCIPAELNGPKPRRLPSSEQPP